MSTLPFEFQCPQCGAQAIMVAAATESQPEHAVCVACGCRSEDLQLALKEAALRYGAKLLQDALRDIPGFKAKPL